MTAKLTALIASLALAASACAAQAQEVTVKVGMVKSITSVVVLSAIEKGYFKEFGIKVETEFLDHELNADFAEITLLDGPQVRDIGDRPHEPDPDRGFLGLRRAGARGDGERRKNGALENGRHGSPPASLCLD